MYRKYTICTLGEKSSGKFQVRFAQKPTRNGQKQQFRQNLWWLAPAFPDMSKNMTLTTQLATLQAIVEIATKLFKGFLFLLYQDFCGNPPFPGSFLHPSKLHQIPHHFLQHFLRVTWRLKRAKNPGTHERQRFFGWRWDGNLGMRAVVGRCPFLA